MVAITKRELSEVLAGGQMGNNAEVLYDIARRGKTYVEIGTLWGGSAIVAGLAGCEVHCIDSWGKEWGRTKPDDVRANWSAAGLDPEKLHLYHQHHPPWPEAIQDRTFDVGLIDGDFEEASRLADWQGMKSHVTKYVLFHDAGPSYRGKAFIEAAKEWEEVRHPLENDFGILRKVSSLSRLHFAKPWRRLVSLRCRM